MCGGVRKRSNRREVLSIYQIQTDSRDRKESCPGSCYAKSGGKSEMLGSKPRGKRVPEEVKAWSLQKKRKNQRSLPSLYWKNRSPEHACRAYLETTKLGKKKVLDHKVIISKLLLTAILRRLKGDLV